MRALSPKRREREDATHVAASLSGFAASDRLDLTQFGAVTSLTYADNGHGTGGALRVADGSLVARIAMIGSFTSAGFHAATDSHGGSFITYTP